MQFLNPRNVLEFSKKFRRYAVIMENPAVRYLLIVYIRIPNGCVICIWRPGGTVHFSPTAAPWGSIDRNKEMRPERAA